MKELEFSPYEFHAIKALEYVRIDKSKDRFLTDKMEFPVPVGTPSYDYAPFERAIYHVRKGKHRVQRIEVLFSRIIESDESDPL